MCGIIGYIGKDAPRVLVDGLKKLEYRGYDSAGIAVGSADKKVVICKKVGAVKNLESSLENLVGTFGIGHTRWATHGVPSDKNAHPHRYKKFIIVHNGIVENDRELKNDLIKRGHKFASDTDSEVIAHILSEEYKTDLLTAVKVSFEKIKGSYAVLIMCEDYPEVLVAVKRGSPLVYSHSKKGIFIASDIGAIEDRVQSFSVLEDGNIAVLKKGSIEVYDSDFNAVKLRSNKIKTPKKQCEEVDDYMLKEIFEIPFAVKNTLQGFAKNKKCVDFLDYLKWCKKVVLVGCGTAYHACLVGKYLLREYCAIDADSEIASEFNSYKNLLSLDTAVIAITQSGETADTLSAIRLAKSRGAKVGVITNTKYSSATSLADTVFLTDAGREVCVASTKCFSAQIVTLQKIVQSLLSKGKSPLVDYSAEEVISAINKVIKRASDYQSFADVVVKAKSVYFLGREIDLPIAKECSLKLKEVSYIHSEGYPSGELKHGTIALMDNTALAVFICSDEKLLDKTANAIAEVKSRGAITAVVSPFKGLSKRADYCFYIPQTDCFYSPLITSLVGFFVAYYSAKKLSLNPDRPRNLAKSVTVE